MRIYGDKPKLYQWDIGRRITHATLSAGQAVHFYNRNLQHALVMTAYELDGVIVADVPNILLQSAMPIHVYLVCTDEDSQFTHASYRFLVTPRPKPDDYVYTETEVLNYISLKKRVDAIEKNGVSGGNIDLTGYVKSVNGTAPDKNGNVEITIPNHAGNNEPLIVNLLEDGTTDKSNADIAAALMCGKQVFASLGDATLALTGTRDASAFFSGVMNASIITVIVTENTYEIIETGLATEEFVEDKIAELDSSQNVNSGMSQTLRVVLYNLLMDAAYLSSGHEADKAALEELLTGSSTGGESGGDDSGDSGETVVYYTIEKTLTNVNISNGTATVVAGSAYSATLTANEGYTLNEVTVTMGDEPVTVTDGVINIASVTGNIVIVATAEAEAVGGYEWESGVPYDLTDKVTEGIELVTGSGRENAKDTYVSTDYLNCFDADAIYHSAALARLFFYDVNKNYISDAYKNAQPSAKLVPDGAVYVRLTCLKTYWTNAKVVPIAKTTETYTPGVQDAAWETGRLDVNTGAEITATSGSRSGYICINGAKCLRIPGIGSMSVVYLYDANKTFICGVTSQMEPIDLIAQYPGFSYIRVYGGTSYNIILDDSTVYTVTRTLTNANYGNANNACSGETYTNTITAKSGFTLDGGTVSVTMGGIDITATAYNAENGAVTIENVTGNIVIKATAVAVTE